MNDRIFGLLYILGYLGTYAARLPTLIQTNRNMKKEDRKTTKEKIQGEGLLLGILMMIWYLNVTILPLIFIFTPWFNFANYEWPNWIGWFGFMVFILAIVLLYRAHSDLGINWSSTIQIQQEQTLTTHGVYRYIRHPIYAAHWLWGIAQLLLLHNWIAGWGGLIIFAAIYYLRIPIEEKMLIEQFGDQYKKYMDQTGRVIPKFKFFA